MIASALRNRLTKSRQSLARGLSQLFNGSPFGDEHFDDLEEVLITADVGLDASRHMVDQIRRKSKKSGIKDLQSLNSIIRSEMVAALTPCELQPLISGPRPYVLLIVGVNGVGKTTSVAKIAKFFHSQGKSVLLAAADTFRAAAVEQLQTWAERVDIPVIAQHQGADAAAVAHDAYTSAMARNVDLLLIDTAGRQHTHSDLMEQLKKIKRVLRKLDEHAPHEVMQVLDATTGQNAISQLRHFNSAVAVNSLCLTKLDGTAKGGVIFALAREFALPIRFIGLGEGADDLRPFQAEAFVDSLLPREH